MIDLGASDFEKDENGVTIYSPPGDLQKIKTFLGQKNIEVEFAETEWISQNIKKSDPAEKEVLQKMFAALEDNEDVNNYYTNSDA